MLKRLSISSIFLISCLIGRSQDSLVKTPVQMEIVGDTLNKKLMLFDSTDLANRKIELTPKKIAMYSAMVPGLGQIVTKKYWKLPLIYGAAGAAAYFIVDNSKNYNYYRKIYAGRLGNIPEYYEMEPQLTNDNIKSEQDWYKRNLDMTVMLSVLGYGIQIMDALVFAHLKEWDISDDLSMKIIPTNINNNALGIGIALKFK